MFPAQTKFDQHSFSHFQAQCPLLQNIQNPLQRRVYSENDVRTPVNFPVNHVAIDMDFDDSTNDHIDAITAGYGSTWTIADP